MASAEVPELRAGLFIDRGNKILKFFRDHLNKILAIDRTTFSRTGTFPKDPEVIDKRGEEGQQRSAALGRGFVGGKWLHSKSSEAEMATTAQLRRNLWYWQPSLKFE